MSRSAKKATIPANVSTPGSSELVDTASKPLLCNICTQDCKEKDLIEQRLERQALELHRHGMTILEFASGDLRSQIRDSLLNQAIKLLRLHNETIDTLARYRRNGEQKVVVQYVNVENGGKAVVGTVVQ